MKKGREDMKRVDEVYYTLENKNGCAESYNHSGFIQVLKNEKIIGYIALLLVGTKELISVPVLEGYRKPYEFTVVDELGTENYIYYEEK